MIPSPGQLYRRRGGRVVMVADEATALAACLRALPVTP